MLRYLVISLFFIGTIFSLVKFGKTSSSWLGMDIVDFSYAQIVFGSSFFTFLCHHSLSGSVAPLKPKLSYRKSFLQAHLIALFTLLAQGMLAFWAFGGLDSNDCNKFPCAIQELFNENFLALPVISEIVNYYPFLNVSAAAILTITLRNNIFAAFQLKRRLQGRMGWLVDD